MKKPCGNFKLKTGLVLLVSTVILLNMPAFASGAIGGGGAVSQYGQAYKQGKAVFFQKVACVRESCAIRKSEVSTEFARSLVTSIDSRGGLKANETATDKIANSLTSDEAEKVKHYLARRFGVKS